MIRRNKWTAVVVCAIGAGLVLIPATFPVQADDEGCMEDQKNIVTQYPCKKDPKPCPQDDTITTTVQLGVNGNAIFVGGDGSVAFTYTIGECDPAILPGDRRYERNCDPEASDEFGSGTSGTVNKLREEMCGNTWKQYNCTTSTSNKELTLPDSVIAQLNALVPGSDPFPSGTKLLLPVVTCLPDEEQDEYRCGGGENTTKNRSDSTCFEEEE